MLNISGGVSCCCLLSVIYTKAFHQHDVLLKDNQTLSLLYAFIVFNGCFTCSLILGIRLFMVMTLKRGLIINCILIIIIHFAGFVRFNNHRSTLYLEQKDYWWIILLYPFHFHWNINQKEIIIIFRCNFIIQWAGEAQHDGFVYTFPEISLI